MFIGILIGVLIGWLFVIVAGFVGAVFKGLETAAPPQLKIVGLVRKVADRRNDERAAVCAVDLLLQWEQGKLDDTLVAWRRYLDEFENGDKSSEQSLRYGAWVPAIPVDPEDYA